MPTLIYAIKNLEGKFLPPMDDDGVEVFMGFNSADDAEQALQSQARKGYIDAEDGWQVVMIGERLL